MTGVCYEWKAQSHAHSDTKDETMKTQLILIGIGLLSIGAVVSAEPPPIPFTPAAVEEVVYARSFETANAFKFIWSKDRPTGNTGTLLVLKVNPDLVLPRQVAMPVLYVGEQTAQRINHGHESGYVIAIVPGDVDLAKSPVWFGTPDFPHQVDAGMARAERQLAAQAGIKPFPAEAVNAARARGGDRLNIVDMKALLRTEVAELILQYAPQESHLADGFRIPVLSREKASGKDSED
jgi:hypothetical protein